MKKVFIILTSVFITCMSSFAQTEEEVAYVSSINDQYELTESGDLQIRKTLEFKDCSKKQIFGEAYNYIIKNYKDANSVIQREDKEEGVIIAKGLFLDYVTGIKQASNWAYATSSEMSAYHILKIECKDGKARVTISADKYISNFRFPNMYLEYPIKDAYPFASPKKKFEQKLFNRGFAGLCRSMFMTIDSIEHYIKESLTTEDDW